MVKPCPKDLKCDVEVGIWSVLHFDLLKQMFHRCMIELCIFCLLVLNSRLFLTLFEEQVSSYAIRDVEEYKNFCDRPKDQRPQPEEVLGVSLLPLQVMVFFIRCI